MASECVCVEMEPWMGDAESEVVGYPRSVSETPEAQRNSQHHLLDLG